MIIYIHISNITPSHFLSVCISTYKADELGDIQVAKA